MQLIHYKGIEQERLGDAPFIGALLTANNCSKGCIGCFNQHLKMEPSVASTAHLIAGEVKQNPLHEGIILGGLEWTEQPQDILSLYYASLWYGLQFMIYTHLEEAQFLTHFPTLRNTRVWCKFGEYDELQSTDVYFRHGVKLASHNQYIVNMHGRI